MKTFAGMTPEYYESGVEIESYLAGYRNYLSLVRGMVRDAQAAEPEVEALRSALALHPGPVRAGAHTEPWCGDWACNLPILRNLFQRAGVPFRVFDDQRQPELKQHYRAEGCTHIPVVSLWDGTGREILRWIEAPQAVEPLKEEWKAANPRLMELYAVKEGNQEAENEFARLYRNLLEDMSRWYRDGLWAATTAEIIALATPKAGLR